MGNTPNYGWPYPALGDPPDGATQIQALAAAADTTLAAQVANLQSQISGIAVPVSKYKTAALIRSSTTLTADPDLTLSVASNSYYSVLANLIYEGTTSSTAFSWSFTAPSGFGGGYSATEISANFGYNWGATASASTPTGATVYGILLYGMLSTGTSGGTFALKWASGTSGQNLTLGAGSILTVQKVG